MFTKGNVIEMASMTATAIVVTGLMWLIGETGALHACFAGTAMLGFFTLAMWGMWLLENSRPRLRPKDIEALNKKENEGEKPTDSIFEDVTGKKAEDIPVAEASPFGTVAEGPVQGTWHEYDMGLMLFETERGT